MSGEIIKKFEAEDLDPKQPIDWGDESQQYCAKHRRNYHFICRGCVPLE